MTIGEIQQVMRAAGWPEDLIVMGAAVAYYESAGGNPRASKVDSLESSYGLFQINLGRPGTALARERAAWGPPERLYDPVYNARLAYQIYASGQGWNAWRTTVYLNPQSYRQYLGQSQAAYGAPVQQPGFDSFDPPAVYDDYYPQELFLPTTYDQSGSGGGTGGLVVVMVVLVAAVLILDL